MLVLNKEELADCKDMFTNAQTQMRFGTLRATINSLHLDLVSVAALTAILGEVSSTNHDPSLLAGYYMACVEQLSGCPRMVWADCGTENGILAALQVFHNDANNQQMYGLDMWHQPRIRGLKHGCPILESLAVNGGLGCLKI